MRHSMERKSVHGNYDCVTLTIIPIILPILSRSSLGTKQDTMHHESNQYVLCTVNNTCVVNSLIVNGSV